MLTLLNSLEQLLLNVELRAEAKLEQNWNSRIFEGLRLLGGLLNRANERPITALHKDGGFLGANDVSTSLKEHNSSTGVLACYKSQLVHTFVER